MGTLAGAFASRRLPGNLISDPSTYRDVRDGEVVWVRLSWLRSFARQVLPHLKARFVLVTGDSDSCVPSELMAEAEAILGSPNVLHWFTQNYDGSADTQKMSPVPFGIDFHMLSERPIWGETCASRSRIPIRPRCCWFSKARSRWKAPPARGKFQPASS